MNEIWLCPKCGVPVSPSRVFIGPDWYECPKCARQIGVPDLDDPNDLGVILRPGVDYSPDPNRWSGMIRSALKKGGGSRVKGRSKPPSKYRPIFPLPLPPQGARLNGNGKSPFV